MIAIGSLPHTDVEAATRLMLDAFPEVASWPQLPRLSFRENMYAQYSEGMPGIRVDADGKRIWFQMDDALAAEMEEFYQAVIDEDLERFRISRDYAAGLDLLLGGAFADELAGRPYVKGHVTGPISYGLTVTDQNKRASLYDESLEQAITKALTLKGRWQSRELRRAAPGASVVIFYDEPYLHSVGSALISVSREQVVNDIKECLDGCGADITGVHCCGNTDWSLVFATGVDVVHFDAYEYMEPFVAYDAEIGEHLERRLDRLGYRSQGRERAHGGLGRAGENARGRFRRPREARDRQGIAGTEVDGFTVVWPGVGDRGSRGEGACAHSRGV